MFLFCLLLTIGVQSQKKYVIRDSVLIPTKSGKLCATIAQNTTNAEKLPVVLFYTAYHQGKRDTIFATRSVDRGYVGLIVYARGIRTDRSNFNPYEKEASDLYDAIDWISKQPWCDGRIAMLGGSYTGYSQWAAARSLHPALKTIVPQVPVLPGFDFPMQNNVPVGFELNWAHTNVYEKPNLDGGLFWEWYEKGYAYSKLDSAAGFENPVYQKWLSHPAYDDYWRGLAPSADDFKKINIPVLTTTGYYDGCQISALEYFSRHLKNNTNANHYMVIGPYDHRGGQSNPPENLRGYDLDRSAKISMRDLAYDWIDWVMKKGEKPALLKDKINVQIMGADSWLHFPTLKPKRKMKFFLSGETLSEKKAKGERVQTVDFNDRETLNSNFHPNLVTDSLDVGGGILYSGEPFIRDTTLLGSFSGRLFIKTNKKDLDVSLSFYEQTADGKYLLLSRYLGRASYCANPAKRKLLMADKTQTIDLKASHFIGKRFKKGSRLLVVANVNRHPFEIINYGSGKNPSDETIKDAGEPLEIKWLGESYIEIGVR